MLNFGSVSQLVHCKFHQQKLKYIYIYTYYVHILKYVLTKSYIISQNKPWRYPSNAWSDHNNNVEIIMHLNKDYLTPDLYTFVSKKRLLVYCTSCTGAVAVVVVVTAGASGAAGAPSWSIWTSRWPIRGISNLEKGQMANYSLFFRILALIQSLAGYGDFVSANWKITLRKYRMGYRTP